MSGKIPILDSDNEARLCFVGDYKPFSNSGSSISSLGNILVGNLECAFSDNPKGSGKAYPILMKSCCLRKLLSHNFTALNLANNHVYDGGKPAFDYMVTVLRDELPDTQFYGLKDTPYAEIEVRRKRIAIIGCLEACRSRGSRLFREEDVAGLVSNIREMFDYVFVTPHWGKEGEYAFHPTPWQRRLARNWIFRGADGIFGHHAHTIHGYEEIQGKPIFYSLGNFLFNHEEGWKYPLTNLGLGVTYEIKSGAWQHTLFIQDGNFVKQIEGELFERANCFLAKISHDISNRSWTMFRWAKTVGPIYISKSNASWRIRFKRDPIYKTTPLWFIWFFLPLNLILRWGSYGKSDYPIKEANSLDSSLCVFHTHS